MTTREIPVRLLLVAFAFAAAFAALAWWNWPSREAPGDATKPMVHDGSRPADAVVPVDSNGAAPMASGRVAAPEQPPAVAIAMIEFRVVDAEGNGVANANVGASTDCAEDVDAWSSLRQLGRTDARGELRVLAEPTMPRFVAAWQQDAGHSRFVQWSAASTTTIELERMDRLVEGNVVEFDGTPARAAPIGSAVGPVLVMLSGSSRQRAGRGEPLRSQPRRRVAVDERGRFSIRVSSKWGSCSVRAVDERRGTRPMEVDVAATAPGPVRLTMPGACGIRGLVLDARGRPVGGTVVLASRRLPPHVSDPASYSGVSAPDGAYEIALFDEGDYDVTALGTALLPWSDTTKVTVAAAARAWLPLSLAEAGDITGVVEPANGAELVKAIRPEDSGASREARVGPDGTFALVGLRHGASYELLVFAGDTKVADARAVAGAALRTVVRVDTRGANERR